MCFFFKQEPRFSQCNRICNSIRINKRKKEGRWNDAQRYDYFLRTFDRFPVSCREKLSPVLAEIMRTIEDEKVQRQFQQISISNASSQDLQMSELER